VKYVVDKEDQGQDATDARRGSQGLHHQGKRGVDAKQECILQYSIHYDEVLKDGTEHKTHYDGNTSGDSMVGPEGFEPPTKGL
jgi:hypothetical protein